MRLYGLIAASIVLFGSAAARADSMIGSVVDVKYLFPNTSAVYADNGTQTVASGSSTTFGGLVTVTFGADTITVTNLEPGIFAAGAFNGVDVSFLSGFNVGGVTIDPASSAAFASGAVASSSSTDVFLNIAGTCASCGRGESIILDISGTAPTSTPEPGSFALLGTGLLGFAGVVKRRLS